MRNKCKYKMKAKNCIAKKAVFYEHARFIHKHTRFIHKQGYLVF